MQILGRWSSDIYSQSVPWNSDFCDRTRFATNNDNARVLNNKILNLAGEGPTYMSIDTIKIEAFVDQAHDMQFEYQNECLN